jgi:hypothetical protein
MPRTFHPGDRVIGCKTAGRGFAVPVLATVVAVTATRVTIEADDPDERSEGMVRRSVDPARLQHAEIATDGEDAGNELLPRQVRQYG